MPSALIALDNLEAAKPILSFLQNRHLKTTHVADGASAMDILHENTFDLILADLNLPKVSGLDLLKHSTVKRPGTKLVLLSKDQSAKTATRAIHAGAFDYLTLPLEDDELSHCLERAFNQEQALSGLVDRTSSVRFPQIIGQSQAIKDVLRMIDKVTHTHSTIMITGESGTGKELVAKAIHQNSPRRDQPLIPVNCGAIPEELLESELFGHEKGAFTSAIRSRAGRFEMAHNGTIFLDEIGDMSPSLQVKLLRVLQERQFERVGGAKTIEVDIRVIAATNKDLHQLMQAGLFREDLFYRLNVIPIRVPPLRERRSDIPLLVEHFLHRFNKVRVKELLGVDREVMDLLMTYDWPGNIRELENAIERMIILTEDEILTIKDLPPRLRKTTAPVSLQNIEIPDEGIDFNKVVSNFEAHILIQALEKSNWVKNRAAQLLNMNRTTLVEKLKKKNIKQPDNYLE